MIDSKTLMIGNWLQWDDPSHDYLQVESIIYDEPNWFVNNALLKDMLPIPLSPSLLERAGLEEAKRLEPCYFIRLGQDFYLNWHQSDGVYLTGRGVDEPFYFDCDYLHQLQNLYHSLCGKELQLQNHISL